ncbi:BRCT domain-containing protein [Bacillus massiliigorillae]|uniref:BRCT domain-containing protein n=1 Tax=Bacillus massiliigorillae TaxID=1243664 RepID=UPI0003A418D8|nr:BRCT domain-containing protein [Bacillus massiliigorillae]
MTVKAVHPIHGKTFVITGVLSKTRREIAAEITKHGGIMTGSVTSKTDYLVIGQRFGNTKVSAAFRLGTYTITEEELREMFFENT